MNRHKNMLLKSVWFKKKEFQDLLNALEGNFKEIVANIMIDVFIRGDISKE